MKRKNRRRMDQKGMIEEIQKDADGENIQSTRLEYWSNIPW